MDSEKRQVDQVSNYSAKEETKIENLPDEHDHESTSASSLESQEFEKPVLKRSLKARHLAVSRGNCLICPPPTAKPDNFYYFR